MTYDNNETSASERYPVNTPHSDASVEAGQETKQNFVAGSEQLPAVIELPQQGGQPQQMSANDSTLPVTATTLPGLAASQPAASSPSHSSSSPLAAEDVDLIEKEWVQKAKEIVAKTANDPHEQNKELDKFKADYIKKRFGKDIKVSES